MANKMTRLLSLILAVLMVVSMTTVIATAQYQYDEAATTKEYKEIDYDSYVGKENQAKKGVYVVNEEWAFEPGEEKPKEVTYAFRGNAITETYDPNRHLATVADMYAKAAEQRVKVPVCILTAGNYTKGIVLTGSVILLGAKAGINPNVPDSNPANEWKLSPERSLPEMNSEDNQGETRIWAGVGTCLTKREDGNELSLFSVAVPTEAESNYIIDGLVFQGYGASFVDTGAGSGVRSYYLQNVIMNDNSAYDMTPVRLWGRGASTTVKKQFHMSNSYITGNDSNAPTPGFYSGHATKLHFNGVSYQQCVQDFVYNVMTMQWVGMDFAMTNCHVWNSPEFATSKLKANYIGRFVYTYTSRADSGSDTEPYHYDISNNTFCNATMMKTTGDLGSSASPFLFYMASSDEMIKFHDNVMISTNPVNDGQHRPPITINYNYISATGQVSRADAVNNISYTSTADYELSDRNLSIENNIFSKEYWKLIDIGTNTSEKTLIENKGNLYTDLPYDAATDVCVYDPTKTMEGVIINNALTTPAEGLSVNNYDKWVWLKYDPQGNNDDPKQKSNYINESKIYINDALASGDILENRPASDHSYSVTMKCDESTYSTLNEKDLAVNTIKAYKADKFFNKGEEQVLYDGKEFKLSTEDRENYYVLSVLSIDGRSSKDYKVTLNRAMRMSAELKGIVDALSKTEEQDTTVDYFNYKVNFEHKVFKFALDVPTDAVATLTDAEGNPVEAKGTNYFEIPLTEVATVYAYDVVVTSPTEGVERYTMSLFRNLNERTQLVVVPTDGTTSTNGNTWNINLNAINVDTTFRLDLSEFATVQVVDHVYGAPLTANNDSYSLKELPVGKSTYTATVTAQNQKNTEKYTLIFDRPARAIAKINGIEGAKANEAKTVYTASIAKDKFTISADYNYADGATIAYYSDAACTKKLAGANLTLTEKTTNVWVKVTAENGTTSVVKQVVIVTTKTATEAGVEYLPFAGNGVIQVTGATSFGKESVTVELPAGTAQYRFLVDGLNGYRVRIYTDNKASLLTQNDQIITLDSGLTRLYVEAVKNGEVKPYLVEIKSAKYYTFSDKPVEWAKDYVKALGTSGMAIMKGDEHGKFNGANNLTRFEMVTMLVRMAGINKDLYSKLSLNFLDADQIPAWAADYVKAAYKYGMINGYEILEGETVVGYNFSGQNNASRAEFLKVFMNAATGDAEKYYNENQEAIDKFVEEVEFKDLDKLEEWAIPYVYSAIFDGIIKGDPNKQINPANMITRNEVAAIVGRFLCGMK